MRAIDELPRNHRKPRAYVAVALLLLAPLAGLACTKSPPSLEPTTVRQPAEEPKKVDIPAEQQAEKAETPAEQPMKVEQPAPAVQEKKPEMPVAKIEPQPPKEPEQKKEAPKPVVRRVRIVSEPGGAEIMLDNAAISAKTTPADVELAEGTHVVQVKKAKYTPSEERKITVSGDSGPSEVAFTLRKSSQTSDKVSVTLRCDPSSATVTVDGKDTILDHGKAKLKLPKTFEQLVVSATASGHVPFDKTLSRAEIDAAKKSIAIRLNPYLRIEQKNADLWVAGKPLAADAERRYELQRNADDRYQLIVTCPGFKSFTETLFYDDLRQRNFTLSLTAETQPDNWLGRAGKLSRQSPWQRHTNTVYAVAFSQKERLLASASRDEWVRLSSYPEKEQSNGSFPAVADAAFKQDKPVLALAFSPDAQWLATGGADRKARLWNVRTRQSAAEFAHDDWVWSVAFSHDGKTLAAAAADGTVSLWNVAGRNRIGDPKQLHDETIACIAFSPDDRTLASASADGVVGLWVVGTAESTTLRAGSKAVHCLAFSPDGKTLASGGDDNAVTLWAVATRQKQATLEGHAQPVRGLAFSPDGQVLASGGSDKLAKLWNATNNTLLQSLAHDEEVYSVAFSPSGWLLATGGVNGSVTVWRSSDQQK